MGFFSAIASAASSVVNAFSGAAKNTAVQAASVLPVAKQEPRFTHKETERGIETHDAYRGTYEFEPKPQLPTTDGFYRSEYTSSVWGVLAAQVAEKVRRVSGALGLLVTTTEHDYNTEVSFPGGTEELSAEANNLINIVDNAPKAFLRKLDDADRTFVERIGRDLPTPAFKQPVSFVALFDKEQEEKVVAKKRDVAVAKPGLPSSWTADVVESRLNLAQAVRAA